MSYNGSGTFNINTSGQPVVAGTIISAATFNALTADLATGLTTALTKDGQTTATARIPFAQGISSTLVTDASSVSTGSIITAGGVGIAKKLYVGTDVNVAGLTASSAVATDASKNLVSVTNTGTGSNVLATGPTIASLNVTTALTLAGAAGTNGQYLTSAGSGLPTWTTISSSASLVRSARTSNTILGVADVSTLIDITSGTFSQTFTAAATLGSGWFCYIRNSGTGDITLDPNSAELIDGLSTYIMYSGECRLVQCDGTAFTSVVLSPFFRTFTASGTFTKPPGYLCFGGELWGGGASGARSGDTNTSAAGGGGGACAGFNLLASALSATETVTIAAGGAAVTTADPGNAGGSTTFGSLAAAYGGSGATGGSIVSGLTVSSAANRPLGYEAGNPGATQTDRLYGIWAGGSARTAGTDAVNSGGSIYGGGAGGGYGVDGGTFVRAPGVSISAGSGGAASVSGNGTAGTAPAGGGGATLAGTASGAGARGELRIWGNA